MILEPRCVSCKANPLMFCFETSVCQVLKLKTHSRHVDDAIVTNAQSHEREEPASREDYTVSLVSGSVQETN